MPGGHAIPYQSFPDVNPTGAPANDLEQIHTSPEMFGGLIAQEKKSLVPELKGLAPRRPTLPFISRVC